jgi:hypothetical protein
LHGCSSYVNRTTEPLVRFLLWLQHTPEAAYILNDIGVWQELSTTSQRKLNTDLAPTDSRSRSAHRATNSPPRHLSTGG